MTTLEIVQKKVAVLPNEIQLQVLDFVNFLATKYGIEEGEDALLEAFLLKRAQQLKKEKRISATNLREQIYKKYDPEV